MQVQGLYAAFYVKDLAASTDFYAKVLGRAPDDTPTEFLVQWRHLGTAGIQLFRDAAKAGKGVMTLVVPDLELTKSALAAHDIRCDAIAEGEFGKIAHVIDPDGNTITLAEPPKGYKNG